MSDDTLPLLTGKCACTHVMSALPSRWWKEVCGFSATAS